MDIWHKTEPRYSKGWIKNISFEITHKYPPVPDQLRIWSIIVIKEIILKTDLYNYRTCCFCSRAPHYPCAGHCTKEKLTQNSHLSFRLAQLKILVIISGKWKRNGFPGKTGFLHPSCRIGATVSGWLQHQQSWVWVCRGRCWKPTRHLVLCAALSDQVTLLSNFLTVPYVMLWHDVPPRADPLYSS